jgi:hypothetical protein
MEVAQTDCYSNKATVKEHFSPINLPKSNTLKMIAVSHVAKKTVLFPHCYKFFDLEIHLETYPKEITCINISPQRSSTSV